MLLLMAEMLHQLIGSLSHYLQGFIHPRWLAGFLPSTVQYPLLRAPVILESTAHVGHALEKSILVGEFAIEQILAFVFLFFDESVGYV